MTLAVIIPVYNRKTELLRCVSSIIAQTEQPDEIIVVDDCSTIDIESILRENFSFNFVVVRNPENIGAAQSRNIGVAHCQSDLIAFLDSDDYWHAEKLEKQKRVFAENGDLGLVYCDMWITDGLTNRASEKSLINKDLLNNLMNWWTGPNTSTLMFKKNIFLELGGFDERLSSCQDHDLWFRAAQEQVSFAVVPERLSYFSCESGSRISLDANKRMKGVQQFAQKWRQLLTSERGKRFANNFFSTYVCRAAMPILKNKIKNAKYFSAALFYFRYLAFNKMFIAKLIRYSK